MNYSFEVIPDLYVPVPDNNVKLFFNSRIESVVAWDIPVIGYFHTIVFSLYSTIDISLNEFTLGFLSSTSNWSDLDSDSLYNYFYSDINGFDIYNSSNSVFVGETLLYNLLVNNDWETNFEDNNRKIRFGQTVV